ncbi:MAG: penicillin-binding protein activator LpoB [Desulfuromonadales bacterium]|nr:penicillin-binding protein activator LpoB [Desulfuromonadales bacterium]
MLRKQTWRLLLLLVLAVALTACGTKVTRMDVEEGKDLSGRWNDTDSRMVAEEMVSDCLERPWLNQYSMKTGKIPDVIVGRVANRSTEHISTETFIKDLERSLLNSGRVAFVASSTERDGVREERADQAQHATQESAKAAGREAGADFMLIGSINSIIDREGKRQVVYYQVDLELIDMVDNRKVWIGNKKIKKFVERSKLGY